MSEQDKIQRSNLPIPDQPHVGLTTYDAKDPDTKYPPIKELRPPKGAPNVLIVLIDDTGFGATSAFGGPCHTPTLAKSRYLRLSSQLAELKGAGRQFRTLLQSLTMDFESASDKTFDSAYQAIEIARITSHSTEKLLGKIDSASQRSNAGWPEVRNSLLAQGLLCFVADTFLFQRRLVCHVVLVDVAHVLDGFVLNVLGGHQLHVPKPDIQIQPLRGGHAAQLCNACGARVVGSKGH
jgi:hypothetical protein